ALDPMSEYHLNQVMLEEAEDRPIIFISHRLSTTKMADRILMMEKGQIIEQGSHEELMRLDGKYAQMFNLQASRYRLVVGTS
ncbi:MAG TPA: ABC transporter ATP-binding protein, partial [Candidatus Paenibacillus intestinavium]|nr:ABC transporter ATP-binding protein [Candidatus Paenibacillus intestinavium]